MFVINQNTALIIFIIIIIISLIIAWSMENYSSYDVGWIHTFISVLVGLGIFVTFMFYYATVTLSTKQNELNNIDEVSRVNMILLNSVFEEIKESSDIIPGFISSLDPLYDKINHISDELNTKTYTRKLVLSSKIFSLWEAILISHKILENEHFSYITEFLQRANSKQLHEQWIATKLNYNKDTQIYGDLLFEYGLIISHQTSNSYVKAAEKFIQDPRYLTIIP